jgi:hypothetical protein
MGLRQFVDKKRAKGASHRHFCLIGEFESRPLRHTPRSNAGFVFFVQRAPPSPDDPPRQGQHAHAARAGTLLSPLRQLKASMPTLAL